MKTKTFLDAQEIPEGTIFQKASFSGSAGHCVELAEVDGAIALRNSRDPERGAFSFTYAEMGAFIEGAKAGEFDHLVG